MPFGKTRGSRPSPADAARTERLAAVREAIFSGRHFPFPADTSPPAQADFADRHQWAYSTLKQLLESNDGDVEVCKLMVTLCERMHRPAGVFCARLMDVLPRAELVRWLMEDKGIRAIRKNCEVDEDGITVLIRALEVLVQEGAEYHPHLSHHDKKHLAFEARPCDELAAYKDYMAGLKKLGEDGASPETSFPLPFESTEHAWMPQESLDQWGFVLAGFYTPSHKAIADRLRKSCEDFGLPYSLHEVSTVHVSLAAKGSTDLRFTKPNFIHTVLERHRMPVLYVDCDCIVMAEPLHVRDMFRHGGTDFACVNAVSLEAHPGFQPLEVTDDTLKGKIEPLRYFQGGAQLPWLMHDQVHGPGGVSAWNNSDAARLLLRAWHQEIAFLTSIACRPCTAEGSRGVWSHAEDQILDWVFNNRAKSHGGELAALRASWLPANYLRVPEYIYTAPVINHPDYASTGPRLKIAAHHGMKIRHFSSCTARKSMRGLKDLGLYDVILEGLVVDIKERKAGSWTVDRGFVASRTLDMDFWPPALLELGDYPKPTLSELCLVANGSKPCSSSATSYKKDVEALLQACGSLGLPESQQTLAALAHAAFLEEKLCDAMAAALESIEPHSVRSAFCCRVAAFCEQHRKTPWTSAQSVQRLQQRERKLYEATLKFDESVVALQAMGDICDREKRCTLAIQYYQRAVAAALSAGDLGRATTAWKGWAQALGSLGESERALKVMEEAAAATVDLKAVPDLHVSRPPPATACWERAERMDKHGAGGTSPLESPFWAPAYLMVLNYSSSRSRDAVSQAHLEWGKLLRKRIGPCERPVAQNRDRSRVLKVGYLSGDFYSHVVADNIDGMLRAHNRDRVHTTCYQLTTRKQDATTERLRTLADAWVSVAGLEASDVVAKIRADSIDICVDLGGHTDGSRLDVMAMRPAPILATWIGYPNTTGVDCIDYRITDGQCDPPESTQMYSEKLVRLSTFISFWKPELLSVPVGASPPIIAKGHITFGTFNNIIKHSEASRGCWSKVLLALPTSKLLMKGGIFEYDEDRKYFADRFIESAMQASGSCDFEKAGKLRKQLIFISQFKAPPNNTHALVPYADHVAMYNDMDVMIDSWPYSGTTTTAEALLMGVPVVTMAIPGVAACHSHNVSASLLKQVGLGELVATSDEEFVRICVDLSKNPDRLQHMKATLRDKCLNSFIKQVPDALCREVEEAYRSWWHKYLDDTA